PPSRHPYRAPTSVTARVCMVIGTGTIGTLICDDAASTSVPKTTANAFMAVDWVCSHAGCAVSGKARMGMEIIGFTLRPGRQGQRMILNAAAAPGRLRFVPFQARTDRARIPGAG